MPGLDSNTKLLLHCDGANGSTTFTDVSASAHTVVAEGNAQVDTAQSKFGGASSKYDGTGDRLRLDGSADFAWAAGQDFTVDFWIRPNTVAGTDLFYDSRPASTSGAYLTLYLTSGTLVVLCGTSGSITGSTLSAGTWYHIAVVRSSGTTKLYVNGTQSGSSLSNAITYLNPASRPLFGGDGYSGAGSGNEFDGWLDEIRVSNIARWTANFTPPTSAYATASRAVTVSGGGVDTAAVKKIGLAAVTVSGGGVLAALVKKMGVGLVAIHGGGSVFAVEAKLLYQVQVGFSGSTLAAFRVGSLVAPSVDAAGYDRIRGVWSTSLLGPYDDVTGHVTDMRVKRGGAQTGSIQSGSIDLTLTDTTGIYDPDNSESPIYGLLDIRLPCVVRVSADNGAHWADLGWGWLRTGDFDYDVGAQEAKFTFEDLFAWLDRYSNPGPVIASTGMVSADVALGLVLDAIGWPSSRRIFGSGSTLANFSADGSRGAKDLIADVLAVDGGTVYQNRAGNFVYANADAGGLRDLAATFEGGQGVRPGLAADNVANIATVTKEGGTPQTYQDDTSILRYGPAGAGDITSPLIVDDAQALAIAARLVSKAKDARYRFWDYKQMAELDTMVALATLDYDDKIAVGRRNYSIVSVEHARAGGSAHMTSWTLVEAKDKPPFRVGSSLIAPSTDAVGYDVVAGG